METASEHSRAEKCVEDGTTDIANQAGLGTIGSIGIEFNPSVSIEELDHPQQEGPAETIVEDDEIGPDDAPEVVWDDTNEEVCIVVLRSLCVV